MKSSLSAVPLLSAAFAMVLALSGCGAATTVPVEVANDLGYPVTLSVCDDDPVDVDQGGTVTVHPFLDQTEAACLVYRLDGAIYLGCLNVSADRHETSTRIRLSQMSTETSEKECGR